MSDAPKGWDDLRPEVKQFALLMESKLREHDPVKGKDSWKTDSYDSLLGRVEEEAAEMQEAIEELYESFFAEEDDTFELTSKERIQHFVDEAVDVANMSMMAIDVLGLLPKLQATQPPLSPRVLNSIPEVPQSYTCDHTGGHAYHKCWCKLECECRANRCILKDEADIKRIKDYWLFRVGNEDVPGSRWLAGYACRPINPQPMLVGYWAKGEQCSDRVQDSDDPVDEIKAIRRTIAWLVKRQWDAEAKAKDISAENADTRSRK